MTNAPQPKKVKKKQRDKTKTQPKTSIAQRLRTDLGRSFEAMTVIQLLWLNRITESQLSHFLLQKLWNQKDTHLKICTLFLWRPMTNSQLKRRGHQNYYTSM